VCHVASALEGAEEARESGTAASLESALREMAAATSELRALLLDPAAALATETETRPAAPTEAADVVGLVRATRRATSFDAADYAKRWCAGLGPMIAPLVERAMTALLESHIGLDASSDSRSDKRIGGYRLVRLLGEGEMGSVWLVSAEQTDRYFVMKVPAKIFERCSPDDRAGLIEALDLESQVLRSIYHPNLANMIDCGWDGNTPYLVLEYLIGVDLERYLDSKLLTIAETKLIFADVCAGLRSLHARGLVHRDLKPGNIFLRLDLGGPEASYDPRRHRDPDATPVLGAVIIDFGIVEQAQHVDEYGERIISGTLGFMPPEQARGVPTTDRADIYGLAATIYASLTGRAFFEEVYDEQIDWLKAHVGKVPLDCDPRASEVPAEIASLVRDSSQLDPRERPDVVTFAKRLADLRG
jgi:serine/threonine-protein kinase